MYKECFLFFLLLIPGLLDSSNSLFYLEGQGIAGYSTAQKKTIFYSLSQEEVMQKPSAGFDYLQRFAGERGDIGALAIQSRFAYDQAEKYKIEPQVYNAYVKVKPGFFDVWLGHNRPAMGMNSFFDSHGLLLPLPAMQGFGFDRDWGAGFYYAPDWGDVTFSGTTGSGMPVYFKGNYLVSGRISAGVLNRDNYNLGLSAMHGKILETMGYHLMVPDPMLFTMAGMDYTLLWDNFEIRLEAMAGKKMNIFSYAFFIRLTLDFLEENRLKIEFQPEYLKDMTLINYPFFAGLSYIVTGDLSLRGMYRYDYRISDHGIVFQVYYYVRII